ncbi:competence protein CoiA family protein [Pseudocolwellia sp. HL-MZ7]|uniref:competence protein CoiA family protein n=1 Tax=Pseudocolwellia sp. HL-MZ7 TaxID=3400627 RepID=UPI003CF1FB85
MSIETNEINNAELSYGLKEGKLVSINDVEQGLNCECHCPYCEKKLVAKKGDIRKHHFAHYDGDDCHLGQETAIHLLAKDLIAKNKKLMLPASYVKVESKDIGGYSHESSYFEQGKITQLENIEIEAPLEGYQPDLIAVTEDGESIDIEVLVTHAVEQEKAQKQFRSNRLMVEIDLSALSRSSSIDEIEQAVIYEAPRHYINDGKLIIKENMQEELNKKVTTINESHESLNKLAGLRGSVENKYLLMGYKFGGGYSTKYNSHFTVGHLYYTKPVQTHDTGNFTIQASGGVELSQTDADESLISQLKNIELPALVSLRFEPKIISGRKVKMIVTDLLIADNDEHK